MYEKAEVEMLVYAGDWDETSPKTQGIAVLVERDQKNPTSKAAQC